MQALWFLTTRQIINGVKRAVKSPRRLIGLLFFALIYLNGPLQAMFFGNRRASKNAGLEKLAETAGTQFTIAPELIIGSIFLGFSGLMMLNSMGILAYRATFKPADVDVLFPTPISPKLMLGVKMVRDSLLTLVMPFFFVLFGAAPIYGILNKTEKPTNLSGIMSAVYLAVPTFLLVSTIFVCFGYGLGLYLSRPDSRTEKESKIIGWTLALMNSAFVAYVAYLFLNAKDAPTAVAQFMNPLNKALFLPAWGATQIVGIGAGTSSTGALLAFVGFVTAIVLAVMFTMSQSKYLLEISALRAAELGEVMDVRKSGSSAAYLAYRAKKGKVKIKRSTFLESARWRGPWALVWRELVVSYRTGLKVFLVIPPIAMVLLVGVRYFGELPARAQNGIGYASVAVLAYVSFIASMTQQRTMVDILKRCDTLKPMPFSSSTTILYEVIGRTAAQLAVVALTFLAGAVLFLPTWEMHVAGAFTMPCLIVLLTVTQMLVLILFPDYDDITQKGFTGVMSLLGMGIVMSIPVGVFALSFMIFKGGIMASAAFSSITMVIIIYVVGSIAARLYEGFNPSD